MIKYYLDSEYTVRTFKVFELINQHKNLDWVLFQSKFFSVDYAKYCDKKFFKLGLVVHLDLRDFKEIALNIDFLMVNLCISFGQQSTYPFEINFLSDNYD